MLRIATLVLLAGLWAGCGEEEAWLRGQEKRCHAMNGKGAYADKLFECFASSKPFTLKLEFNKDTDFKRPTVVKLFEARYEH